MRKLQARQSAMEERLRQSSPTLRSADSARVDKACARIASAPSLSPLRTPHTFIRPLLRVAACVILMLGIAALMRPKPPPAVKAPRLPSIATFSDLTDLMVPQNLKNTLACEAEDLASDIVDLTAVLNERTLSILF